MTPTAALQSAIVPALEILGERFQGPRAEVMLLTIAQQESGLRSIQQKGGSAMGFYQFNDASDVDDVITRPTSRFYVTTFCGALNVKVDADVIFHALNDDEILASGFARMKLWNMPEALPLVGDALGSYQYYLDCWRPGKPKPDSWPDFYQIALATVGATTNG